MDMNNFSFTGRLTKDAERKVFPSSGTIYALFDVANNTGWGEYAKTQFFKCKMIGKGAEALLPYLKKGQLVGVTGTMETNDWTDRDGVTRKDWSITTSSVNLLGGKREDKDGQQELDYASDLDAKLKAEANARYQSHGKSNNNDDIPF